MVSVDIGSSNACVRVERSKLAELLSTAHREQAVIRHKSIGVVLHALNTEQKRVWGQRKIWPGAVVADTVRKTGTYHILICSSADVRVSKGGVIFSISIAAPGSSSQGINCSLCSTSGIR